MRSRGVDVKSAVSDALDKQWAIVLSGCVEYVSSIERGALEEAAASFTKTIKPGAELRHGTGSFIASIRPLAIPHAAVRSQTPPSPRAVTALFKADAQSPSRGPFWVFVVRAMAANTRLVGSRCDQAAAAAGQPTKYNSEMFNNLRELFRIFQHEPEDSVRRRATLAVSAEHLRVAFNMNKINLGFVHLSTMDRSDSPALRSDLVTFHYYRGRLLMFNDE